MANSDNREEMMQDEPKKTENSAKEKSSAKSAKKKGGRFQAIKAEFKRIVWPDKDTIVKETTAVVVATVILGVIIALLDLLIKTGLDKIFQLG